jgi:hypothetical protein
MAPLKYIGYGGFVARDFHVAVVTLEVALIIGNGAGALDLFDVEAIGGVVDDPGIVAAGLDPGADQAGAVGLLIRPGRSGE